MTALKIVNALPEPVWRDFISNHPMANIFHTPEMFNVFARAKGHRPTLWAAVTGQGNPLALLLPVQVTVVGGPLRFLTTRAILYGGLLCVPGMEGEKALQQLLQAYKQSVSKKALFTEIRHLSNASTWREVLNDNGFFYQEYLNYLVDLNRSSEKIMQSIGKRTRKHIRRALRDERMSVEEVTDCSQLSILYELFQKTFDLAGVYLADHSLFEAAYDLLYSRGMARFLLVRVGEEYAAASIELLFKETIYGWYGGMDRAYSRHHPNEFLNWHILKWGAENGYLVYDFGGAGTPDETYGVRDFKAKFGGDLVEFGRNMYAHSPGWIQLSTWGYKLYQSVLRLRAGEGGK